MNFLSETRSGVFFKAFAGMNIPHGLTMYILNIERRLIGCRSTLGFVPFCILQKRISGTAMAPLRSLIARFMNADIVPWEPRRLARYLLKACPHGNRIWKIQRSAPEDGRIKKK